MAFPKRKILTIRAEAYVKSMGKKLADYEPVGVQVSARWQNIYEAFADEVPRGAEVVTDLSRVVAVGREDVSGLGDCAFLSGTALILRKRIPRKIIL